MNRPSIRSRIDAARASRVATALTAIPRGVQLILEDAAYGLITYVLDGQVHLPRLADPMDVTVADGTLALFTDTGLVYANGSRIRLIPFASLPLSLSKSASRQP